MKLVAFLTLASTFAFAENWSGILVDSNCYASHERNVTLEVPDVNHSRVFQIDHCAPTAKTRKFTVVEFNGQSFQLNEPGDAQAAQIIEKTNGMRPVHVEVSGTRSGSMVQVTSIVETH